VQCEQTDENLWDDTIYEPLLRNETDLSDVAQTSLYYLIGALLFKIKKNFKHCDQCFNTLLSDCRNELNNNPSFFIKLREYKDNILIFPSIEIYNIIYKCELLFRRNEHSLISNKLKLIEFVQMFLNNCCTDFVPTCHNIVYKLIKTFVIARIHFTLKKENIDITELNTHSSRSVAMKSYVKNHRK